MKILEGLRAFMVKYKNWLIAVLLLVAIGQGIYYSARRVASQKAMHIFNKAVANQNVLLGKITVADINADVRGYVTFTNLLWLDTEGNKILDIPSGEFKVDTWDIVTGNFKTTTIQGITINDADVAVRFNEDMSMNFVRQPKVKPPQLKPGQQKNKRPVSLQEQINRLNLESKPLNLKLSLNNCRVAAFYKKRQFILTDVNADIDCNTRKKLKIDFSTGAFGGTMVGNDLKLNGTVDMTQKMPVAALTLYLNEIEPSSLGFGLNINNPLYAVCEITGPIDAPVVDGGLSLDTLDLPALNFTKVKGDLHYEGGYLTFDNVKAFVYGGTVDAHGDYDIDSRYYNIYVKGHDLLSDIALKTPSFKCKVELDLKMASDGVQAHTLTSGTFKSGSGSVYMVPFQSLEGSFSNLNKTLSFSDVIIHTKFGTITAEPFKIDNGKLRLGHISLYDEEKGKTIKIR